MAFISRYFACAFAMVSSLSSFAGIEETRQRYKEVDISFEGASTIEMTITMAQEVDTCNSFGLDGVLLPIGPKEYSYYLASLSVIGTQRVCLDETRVMQAFTKSFVVQGSRLTMILPENATLSARALS